eukprot:377673-Rhodomonas_salina.1
MVLRARYALSGTEAGYAPTRPLCAVRDVWQTIEYHNEVQYSSPARPEFKFCTKEFPKKKKTGKKSGELMFQFAVRVFVSRRTSYPYPGVLASRIQAYLRRRMVLPAWDCTRLLFQLLRRLYGHRGTCFLVRFAFVARDDVVLRRHAGNSTGGIPPMGPRIDPYLSPTRSKLVRDYNDSPPHAERVSVCDLPPLSCWFAVTSRPYPVRSWLFAVTSCPYPALSWPRLALFREESTALSLRAAAILLGNLPPVVRGRVVPGVFCLVTVLFILLLLILYLRGRNAIKKVPSSYTLYPPCSRYLLAWRAGTDVAYVPITSSSTDTWHTPLCFRYGVSDTDMVDVAMLALRVVQY